MCINTVFLETETQPVHCSAKIICSLPSRSLCHCWEQQSAGHGRAAESLPAGSYSQQELSGSQGTKHTSYSRVGGPQDSFLHHRHTVTQHQKQHESQGHLILSSKPGNTLHPAERAWPLVSAPPCDPREVTSVLQASSSLSEKDTGSKVSSMSSNSQSQKFLFPFGPDLDNFSPAKTLRSLPQKKHSQRRKQRLGKEAAAVKPSRKHW